MTVNSGFFVGLSRHSLLAEVDACLENEFADFQRRSLKKIGELISAESYKQIQTCVADVESFQQLKPQKTDLIQAQESRKPQLMLKGCCKVDARDLSTSTPVEADFPAQACYSESLEVVFPMQGHSSKQEVHVECDAHFDKLANEPFVAEAHSAHPIEEIECTSLAESGLGENDWSIVTSNRSVRRMVTISSSQEDFAALRQELDIRRCTSNYSLSSYARATKLKKLYKLCAKLRKRCVHEAFQIKDLNFNQMAARKGLQWKELSLEEQAELIRNELTSVSLTIDPQSHPMKLWDVLILCCLILTALVLPYEVAFLESGYGALYFINRTIDMIFLVDMVMQFFLMVQLKTRNGTRWVQDRKQIATIYLKSWFVLDVLSIIPYDDISTLASSSVRSGLQHLKVLRLIRVLRLLKLFRLLRASRVAKRWENRNSLKSSTKHLARCFLLIITSAHWMACIWAFFGMWEGSNLKCRRDLQADDQLVIASPKAAWYVDVDEGSVPNDPDAWKGQSWVVAFALGRASSNPFNPCSHASLYIVSIYWAIMTMTSIGYGDIVPQVVSEYVVSCLCMIVSGILWAYVIGIASSTLSNMYPEVTEFEQKMDAFNAMAVDMQVPTMIRQRGREYLRESRYKWSHERNITVIQNLGPDLRANISKESADIFLGNIGVFSRCSQLFRADCAASMIPHFFEPHYVVQLLSHLNVVEKGAIGHAGQVLIPFQAWGEDFILANIRLRRSALAVALNYALVVSLSKDGLENVLAEHPLEHSVFARAAVCLAFRGAMRLYISDLDNQEEPSPANRWIHEVLNGRHVAKL